MDKVVRKIDLAFKSYLKTFRQGTMTSNAVELLKSRTEINIVPENKALFNDALHVMPRCAALLVVERY